MNIGKTLYVPDRKSWRAWLGTHYRSEKEIWLVYHKKESGKTRIPYNDAVEEALCFGWIDSIIKKIDGERFAQRFSPRRPGRPYSQANRVRLRAMIAKGKVRREVLASLPEGTLGRFVVPPDILSAIKRNRRAWTNFRKLSGTYKEIRIGFIPGSRNRPEAFRKRLRYFIAMTEKNRLFGFGGIQKHY